MKNSFKIKMLVVALVASTPVFAATPITKQVGTKVYGYMPYYSSIGSQVLESPIEESGVKKVAVGAKIEVPSYLYRRDKATSSKFFTLLDSDNDVGASFGNPDFNLGFPTTYKGTPSKKTDVRWFIITAGDGYKFADETAASGQVIDQWTEDSVKIISEISDPFVDFTAQNTNSPTLVVPEAAVGYRIGFWSVPETENGVPYKGKVVKVFDLNHYFKQEPPKEPGPGKDPDEKGNPDPDNPCIDGDCGVPVDPINPDNPGGGGGVVPGDEWVINIYDKGVEGKGIDGNGSFVLVKPEDAIKVNHEYFATIRFKSATRDETTNSLYRDPTPAELDSLSWAIVNPDIADTTSPEYTVATYSSADTGRVINNDGKVQIGVDQLTKYTFKTQKTNEDAKTKLQETGPNYSEQGWSLELRITKND